MTQPAIRSARSTEYDDIARLWMESWVSTGLDTASDHLLADWRARVHREVEGGWSLFLTEDDDKLAAMLAVHRPTRHLGQLFVAPAYQGRSVGRQLLAFTRQLLPDAIWLRCVRENEKAWRWYEREGFVFERQAIEPTNGLVILSMEARWSFAIAATGATGRPPHSVPRTVAIPCLVGDKDTL